MSLLKFDECLARAGSSQRHLLLGNGFSRACRNNVFSYDSLFQAAAWDDLSKQAHLSFEALGTYDFEFVMESLENATLLARLYGLAEESCQKMKSDAERLRDILVDTLARHHPDFPGAIKDDEFTLAVNFIDHFERIYTLNYDLLLSRPRSIDTL